MIGAVALALNPITRFEVDADIGTGSHRPQIGRRFPGIGAFVRLEDMLRDDHAGADEGVCPKRRRPFKANAHREGVDLFYRDAFESTERHRCGSGVSGILPVEHDIVRGERLAVMPLHALFQLPGHRLAVGCDAAVLDVRNFGGEHRQQIAIGIPGREWLVKDPAPLRVFCANGEMRIERGRRLPEQRLERAATTRFGRFVLACRCRLRDAGMSQELACKWRGQLEAHHPSQEGAARHAACFNGCDELPQLPLVHGNSPTGGLSKFHRRWKRRLARLLTIVLINISAPRISTGPKGDKRRRARYRGRSSSRSSDARGAICWPDTSERARRCVLVAESPLVESPMQRQSMP
jgi:hypothetical protein